MEPTLRELIEEYEKGTVEQFEAWHADKILKFFVKKLHPALNNVLVEGWKTLKITPFIFFAGVLSLLEAYEKTFIATSSDNLLKEVFNLPRQDVVDFFSKVIEQEKNLDKNKEDQN